MDNLLALIAIGVGLAGTVAVWLLGMLAASGRALVEGRVVHIADVKADPEYTSICCKKMPVTLPVGRAEAFGFRQWHWDIGGPFEIG